MWSAIKAFVVFFHTEVVINDFSAGKHWAQITSNFLAEFAEISSYSVSQSLKGKIILMGLSSWISSWGSAVYDLHHDLRTKPEKPFKYSKYSSITPLQIFIIFIQNPSEKMETTFYASYSF